MLSPFVGGAFGSKAGLPPYALLTIAAARGVGAPVRLMVTRAADVYGRDASVPSRCRRSGSPRRGDGRLTAFEHIETAQTSQFDPVVNPGTHMTRAMYACPNIRTEQRLARSDTNTPGFMRAPNEMQTFFALESAMDELAIKLGLDPVELRRVNDTSRHPVADVPFSSRSLMACYDAAAKSFGWSRRSAAPRSMIDGDWLVGYGCATRPTRLPWRRRRPVSACTAAASAVVELAAHDVGTGAYTIMGQIAAARLGLPVGVGRGRDGRLEPADRADFRRLGHVGECRLGRACGVPEAGRRDRTHGRRPEGHAACRGSIRRTITLDNGMLKAPGGGQMIAARRAEGDAARRSHRRRRIRPSRTERAGAAHDLQGRLRRRRAGHEDSCDVCFRGAVRRSAQSTAGRTRSACRASTARSPPATS